MRISKAIRVMAADHGPARRKTYCRHWRITELRCAVRGECPNAELCCDYQDAVEYHERRLRQEGRLLVQTR